MSKLDFKSLTEPGNKYKLGLKIGGGVGGEVYEAVENQTGKKVAIKMVLLEKETEDEIQREYNILKQMSASENFPEFYEVCLKNGKNNTQKIWLVMEFCEGGEAINLVRKLEHESKRMSELHIAYILRETIKAVTHLHENDINHRDIRGSNILFTADARIKLIDYGISKRVEKNIKMKTCMGSPSWLAPEVITCQTEEGPEGYDKKADVWALGITAIELGDGLAPFEDIHPGRALFQIVKNPPPTLRKPSDWSQLYNDFISECLIKTPEHRPFVQELLAHPFFEPLDKEEKLLEDLKALLEKYKDTNLYKKPDVQVRKGYIKTEARSKLEKILQEDLAAMTKVSEDSVLFELHERLKKNEFHTFIGDILLILNANKISDIYGSQYHKKYCFKAQSQNAPHIYSTANSAYRDVFHHEKPQQILLAGETGAGKTASMMHIIDHLLFLGQGLKSSEKVRKALSMIHAIGNAGTLHNANSTRHVLQTKLTFTDTGKVSGAIFRLYLLEKERVTTTTKKQENFHLFYYFYDAIKSEGKLEEFHLAEKNYKFLKMESNLCEEKSFDNINSYQLFERSMIELEFEENQINAIKKILAAILLLGEIEFLDDDDSNGVLATPEIVENVADLLEVDKKKLSWALLNYCLIINGEATMRQNSKQEAEEAKNVFARGLYSRLVDWIVNTINEKISVSRIIYGDRHVISLLDFYGFECYKKNTLNQLLVNAMNEQLQFHYNQRIFAWNKVRNACIATKVCKGLTHLRHSLNLPTFPKLDINKYQLQSTTSEMTNPKIAEEEEIPFPNLDIKDNKTVIDLIMSKPEGLLHYIDEATRKENASDLLDNLKRQKGAPVLVETSREFSIYHYTGKITYDAFDIVKKNRDFLPPEIINTMRLSKQGVIKTLFSSLLSKSGNLSKEPGRRCGNLQPLVENEKNNEKKSDTTPAGQYSQSRQMRTAASTYRGACAELFTQLTSTDLDFHFVRCIKTDLSDKPGAFDPEVVRQQLRALSVVNTILNTQQGHSYSVPFNEFVRRYKFLAFDFDEYVEETKDNCRLLLLRLKLEGWTLGKTKVFLKYFNKEYLSRLYETQIKKIVKIQSMMRAFMARKKLYVKIKKYQVNADKNNCIREEENEEEIKAKAARIIQKRLREYTSSKYCLTESQKEFIQPWYKRWRTQSIFQVLLMYAAERNQALVNFCLQIHLYNQNSLTGLQRTKTSINLEDLDLNAKATEYLPNLKIFKTKPYFEWRTLTLREDLKNCEPLPNCNISELEAHVHAIQNQKTNIKSDQRKFKNFEDKETQTFSSEDISVLQNKNHETIQNSFIISQQNEHKERKLKENKEEINGICYENQVMKSQSSMKNKTEVKKDQFGDKNSKPIKNNQMEINLKLQKTTQNNQLPLVKLKKISSKNITPEQRFQTSLSEIEEKFKNKNYDENGDDSPFNFRALLRKTNYCQELQKNSHNDLIYEKPITTFTFVERKKSLQPDILDKYQQLSEIVTVEIAPGISIYGQIADL